MEAEAKVGSVRRILRLWRVYALLDFMLMTRDLKTFLMWAISDTILNVASVTGMLLLAERFAGIGAWSKYQFLFLLGYVAVVDGLLATFFSYNVLFISRRLGRGQFDHTLIQPQPIWMAMLTDGFSPFFGLPTLLPGLGLILWAVNHLPGIVSIGWVLQLLASLAASAIIVVSFQFTWGSLAFWAPRAAEEISSSTNQLLTNLKPFPLDGVGALLTGGLLTVLPVGFVGWYPCRVLLGVERTGAGLWLMPLAALLFALLAWAAFSRGLKHYGRTGSQRYDGWAHRG